MCDAPTLFSLVEEALRAMEEQGYDIEEARSAYESSLND
jgi:hypothetical protein